MLDEPTLIWHTVVEAALSTYHDAAATLEYLLHGDHTCIGHD